MSRDESLVVNCWLLVVVFVKPKNSEFVVRLSLFVCRFFELSSIKPSRFVGMIVFFFGILTMPFLWSSWISTILFFFLKNIIKVSFGSI